jgi:RimJ/RimL family protein N-acetyltransferase
VSPPKVEIREPRREDAPAIQALAEDPAIGATTLLPQPYPPDGAATFVERAIAHRAAGTEFVFAVFADDLLVGMCGLHEAPAGASEREIGYWIGRPFWNRGYGRAAVARLVDWAFDNLPLERLYAVPLERNEPSIRILASLGFIERARRPNDQARWLPTDVLVEHSLKRADWATRRG